ncbi:MAG: hypothetical protein L0956_08445, partial [Candidatus Mariimomonas ferrooxydans]
QKYIRHLVYTDYYFVVFDEIVLNSAKKISWFFHSYGDISTNGNDIMINTAKANVSIKFIRPANIASVTGEMNTGNYIEIYKTASQENMFGVFYPEAGNVNSITDVSNGQVIGAEIELQGRKETVTLDRTTGQMSFSFTTGGDLNGDGDIDIDDLVIVASNFGKTESHEDWNPTADVVRNGEIDIYDMVFVASRFT